MRIVNEIAPDENTIIAMGSAQFATNCKGLSSTPIAKITRYLTDHTVCLRIKCSRTFNSGDI